MKPNVTKTDCRNETGITVGLIDSIITAARVLKDRVLSPRAVQEALIDLRQDEDIRRLLNQPEAPTVKQVGTRQKTENMHFTFLYPGRQTGGNIDHNASQIAIPHNGEWVTISGPKKFGEQPSASFYDPQELRDLAAVLNEAADLFEENRRNMQSSKRDADGFGSTGG